jgi:secreted PhoX family phosphatase
LSIQGKPGRISRKAFLGMGGMSAAALVLSGTPLGALGGRAARGEAPPSTLGYGKPVLKGDLWLPPQFNYQIVSRQGQIQRDGNPTPGFFDGMGAFPDTGDGVNPTADTTILIRNHENRERGGEQDVVVPPAFEYDSTTLGGCTKLVVRRRPVNKKDPVTRQPLYRYEVLDSFNILGGTSTNCAGGEVPFQKWITCEEVVKGPAGTTDLSAPLTPKKHGYMFEVNAMSDGPVQALPITSAGRFEHEAAVWGGSVLYMTEDRRIEADPVLGQIGACLYRYIPDQSIGQSTNFAETTGPVEALKVKDVIHKNMDTEVEVGVPLAVEWVLVDDPDHDDDTNNRRDRAPGFTPTRIQAQDKGAAYFDRQEGMWVGQGGQGDSKIYFDCTEGGLNNLGQIWEYDPGRETITLVYQSADPARLENPDNITIVPQTGDVLLCEDSPSEQFIRGVTIDGEIYDFAKSQTNSTEFCGACFDPDGNTLYVNQQGDRGVDESGQPAPGVPPGVTYAIYGPFGNRTGANDKDFGTGPGPNK